MTALKRNDNRIPKKILGKWLRHTASSYVLKFMFRTLRNGNFEIGEARKIEHNTSNTLLYIRKQKFRPKVMKYGARLRGCLPGRKDRPNITYGMEALTD